MRGIISDKENKALRQRLQTLRKTCKISDRLTAILMDEHSGGFGMDECYARPKAEIIMDELGLED